jgi:hypothetical protein
MEQGIFEISIDKDVSGAEIDKNNLSNKAVKSFKTFLESIEEIAEIQFKNNNTIDLGTNKIAIKATVEDIDKLEKNIKAFSENKLPKTNKIYKALQAIENVISANGITYSAIIKGSRNENNITSVFKKEPEVIAIATEEKAGEKEKTGLMYFTGKITKIDLERHPNTIKFAIDKINNHTINCSAQQIYSLRLGQTINIYCKFSNSNADKISKELIDDYSTEEFQSFNAFYQNIDNLEGTERLKYIYRFFNQYINKDELTRVAKFAKIFLYESHDPSVLRIIIDVLKQVSDEEKIQDVYNSFLELIKQKIGSIN